jgi:hypothetical protein
MRFPIQIAALHDLPERARGAADGVLDRVLDAHLRGTGDLDDAVDVIGDLILP